MTFVACDDGVQVGWTALHVAAVKGHNEIVQLLLPKMSEAAINLNPVRDPSFFSLVHIAMWILPPCTIVSSHAYMTFGACDELRTARLDGAASGC